MDNIEQPIQTNPIPTENLLESEKRMNSKIIIISALIGLMFLVAIGYAYYRYSQSTKNMVLPFGNEPGSVTKTSCSLSGQKEEGVALVGTETKFTNLPPRAKKSGEVIARVLSVNPFLIEILDSKPDPSSSFDGLGIEENFFVSNSEKAKILSLKFNDIISANLYGFTYDSGELAFGVAMKDIKKIEDQAKYFNNSQNPLVDQSGILISYTAKTANTTSFLLVFNDRKVFYLDNSGNVFTDKQLTEQELKDLMELFSRAQYNNIPSDFSVSHSYLSLSLICNRYQPVSLDKNISQIKPITDKLDSIINSYRSKATMKLTYNERYLVKNWEYGSIVPLDEVSKITFRKENKARLSQIKPSESLKKEIESFDIYYRYNGKIYNAYFGGCDDESAPNWGCFDADELDTESHGRGYYQMWPKELSVKLKDVGPKGVVIPKEDYLAHEDFYDTLLTWEDNIYFLEGDYLYQRLWVSLK